MRTLEEILQDFRDTADLFGGAAKRKGATAEAVARYKGAREAWSAAASVIAHYLEQRK
jgi:hypothetical protein